MGIEKLPRASKNCQAAERAKVSLKLAHAATAQARLMAEISAAGATEQANFRVLGDLTF